MTEHKLTLYDQKIFSKKTIFNFQMSIKQLFTNIKKRNEVGD